MPPASRKVAPIVSLYFVPSRKTCPTSMPRYSAKAPPSQRGHRSPPRACRRSAKARFGTSRSRSRLTTCSSARLAPLTAPRMPRSEASARMRTPSPTGPAKPAGAAGGGGQRAHLRLLDVRRVVAAVAGHDRVLARGGQHLELVRQRAADGPGARLDGTEAEPAAREDAPVGVEHVPVLAPRVLDVDVERVRVLHDELAPAHEPEARPDLVAELHLDLVEVLREIAVGANFSPHQVRDHLLVGRTEAEVALVAILHPQELASVLLPAPALPPELGRDDGRHQDLLRAGAVHFISHDVFEAAHGAEPERQEVVDAARHLPHHARAHEQLVAHHLGIGRILPQRRHQEAGEARHLPAAWCSSSDWRARPPWLQAAPAAIAMATKVVSAISWSVAPALVARAVCASMHHGHWVICATPSAISSFVFTVSAPSANALPSNSRNARYASGASSRMRFNCFFISTPWNVIAGLLSRTGRPSLHYRASGCSPSAPLPIVARREGDRRARRRGARGGGGAGAAPGRPGASGRGGVAGARARRERARGGRRSRRRARGRPALQRRPGLGADRGRDARDGCLGHGGRDARRRRGKPWGPAPAAAPATSRPRPRPAASPGSAAVGSGTPR